MATPRLPTTPVPAPIERFAVQFDDLFVSRSQRQAFRDVLVGLLRPRDRAKTLTALADTEPGREGSLHPDAQRLHTFLAESPWNAERAASSCCAPTRSPHHTRAGPAASPSRWPATALTAPHPGGALLLDDSGDRKRGHHTAHVARQYLGSVGKVDNGIRASPCALDEDVGGRWRH